MRSDLEAAMDSGDERACVRLLRGLDEKARRPLHPLVARKLDALELALKNFSDPSRPEHLRQYAAARLAMLGTANIGELKRISAWVFNAEAAHAILVDRRPVWLADWADFEIARSEWNWTLIRALVRDELIPKPSTESYALGLLAAPGRNLVPRQLLERDRGLLDDEVWRLFEVEGSGERSLAAYDKYVQRQYTWLESFRAMAADGILSRERLLVSTLDALSRDFAPFRAGWYSRLHDALKPTRAERVQLRERYLDLLGSRVPATVSFAMKAVVEVDKAGALDPFAALERLGSALEARDKGTAGRALAILAKVSRGSAGDRARVAAVAERALTHESAEVQAAALSLLPDPAAAVGTHGAVLAPSVRARFGFSPAAVPAIEAPAAAEVPRVVPVADASELAELFAAVLENQGPPIDIERVIDGVARILAPERVTASLARRAAKLLERSSRGQPRAALAELALAWTRDARPPQPRAEENLEDFLLWRLWHVGRQAADRIERPLLSLPTWPDGRIDPADLRLRIDALPPGTVESIAADRSSPFHLDLLQARLRAEPCPDSCLPRMNVSWRKRSWEVAGQTYSHHEPTLDIPDRTKPSRFDPAMLSTSLLHAPLEMKRWCATVCPRWREGWFAAGCRALGSNLDWNSADWSTRAYLEPLLDPVTAIGPMGGLLLVLGLAAKEPGESLIALDALIASLGQRRLDGPALGHALVDAAASGAIKFTRWTTQLTRAARAGAPQDGWILLALDALFESGHGAGSPGYSKLRQLANELRHQTGLHRAT